MMIERVIIVGDSFTYGHGCPDRIFYVDKETKKVVGQRTPDTIPSEYCWASLLKKDYDIEVVNLARCGHSNPAMFRDLVNHSMKDKKPTKGGIIPKTLVIFAASSTDRIEASGAKGELHSWVLGHDWDPAWQGKLDPHQEQYWLAKKMYITHLYDDAIGKNIALMSILAAQQYSTLRGFKFVTSIPTTFYDVLTINHLWDYGMGKFVIPDIQSYDFSGCLNDWVNKNEYKCVDDHTNEKGHKLYYQKVIKPIIEKHINE
jgi:hypothetical protein